MEPETDAPATLRCTVPTRNASSYLQRLCKHFAHKVPTEWDAATGHAALPGGRVEFVAIETRLEIVIRGDDPAGLDRARAIVEDHLLRYAFRENFTALDWKRDLS